MVKSRRKSSTRKVCFWVKKRKSTRRRKTVRRISPPNTFRRLREEELMALNSAFPNKPRGSLSLVRRPLTPSQRIFLQNYNTNNYDDMPLNQRLRLRADNIPRASGSMTGSVIRSNTIFPPPAVPPMSLPVYGPRNYNEDDDDSSLGSSTSSTSTADFLDLK